MKPPMPYYGGKTTLGPTIAELLPAHRHYVEPFAGSLAVLLAKPPSDMETVNDLDGGLMTFWRILRDRPGDLERVCALTPHSRQEFAAAWDVESAPDDLERARRVWVLLTQGRAGIRTNTGWRHFQTASGSTAGMPRYLDGYVGRIAPVAERLHHVTLECRPALDIITRYGRHADVLIYADPPYLGSARSSGGYLHEMRGTAEHRELADALQACNASVVLSGYPSDLYDRELYPDWYRVEFAASTGQGGIWANRTEVLWSNRPLASTVQPDLFAS